MHDTIKPKFPVQNKHARQRGFASNQNLYFFRFVKEQTAYWSKNQKKARALFSDLFRGVGGGGERDRTDDLLLAKQALSQLSYTPDRKLVGLVGFEPTTPRLSSVCSDQLSYRPGLAFRVTAS
jgi:hypothetical protein